MGRGYWFRIRDGDAVEWVRPATDANRRFQLEPGRQLVAWAGRSDIELVDAIAGLAEHLTIAQRWIAAEQRSLAWLPDPSLQTTDIPPLRRGEAIEVTLTEATEWLQPSGVYHRVAFAGGLQHQLPDDLRETVEADVAWVVELFASRFAWEMETRRLTVRIATTPETLARLQSRQRATTSAWARSPVTRAGVNEIVMSPTSGPAATRRARGSATRARSWRTSTFPRRRESVDVEPNGSFEVTLPRFDSAGPGPLNYGISVCRADGTGCTEAEKRRGSRVVHLHRDRADSRRPRDRALDPAKPLPLLRRCRRFHA